MCWRISRGSRFTGTSAFLIVRTFTANLDKVFSSASTCMPRVVRKRGSGLDGRGAGAVPTSAKSNGGYGLHSS
jgi:hypothetical protein